jgi:rfaE bifunctional protein nucleotidyltransferase chain/domain
VGINSDDSISRIKGSNRPINNQKSRLYNIASMFFVDMVVVFNDDTPLSLIKALCPNIITKGGDWNLKDIVGYEFMTERGGRIYTIPHITGYSTTNLENKILNKLF